jgi:IS605 OrfB family transposase
MPNDKKEKEMLCRNGKPYIPKQYNAIVFNDGDKIPFNNELCSKKGFIAEETPSLPNELENVLDILVLDEDLEKDVFTITEMVTQTEQEIKQEYLTLTEKIQIKWTPEISSLCYNIKNMYNFGNFVMRKLFFIKNKNPNCSWDDFLKIRQSIMPDPSIKNYAQKREVLLGAFDGLKKGIRYRNGTQIKNSLNTLLKFSKFYNDTGYAQISQQILQVLGSNWLTYFTNDKKFYKGELNYRPNIPRYLDSNGEFMVIYTGQLMRQREAFNSHLEETKRTTKYKKYKKTTSEMLFPKRHENIFPQVRVRYEILQELREVRVIPCGNYYEIEIRYNKQIKQEDKLCQDNAISIDLGVNYPFAIANNFGAQPLLIIGREYKRANYIINSKSPYYRSIQSVYGDILKKSRKSQKPILQIIQEKTQKYLKTFQWKKDVADIVLNNPTMMYNQFKNKYGKNKKLKSLFNYLKDLFDIETIKDYLFYEENELNRRLDICDNLEYDLKGKPENTHVQRVKDLQLQNQIILDGLFKIYRNKTRDAIHKMSRYIIDYCKQYKIGMIVIGYNEGWKTRLKLSRAVNRRFIPLPFYKIIESIKYKAVLCGINIIVQEESYTSKCSALDKEAIKFHLNYDGVRNPTIRGKDGVSHNHYGQFYSYKSDKYIHSDINGAFNIGRKGVPSLFDKIPQSLMLIPPKKIAVT